MCASIEELVEQLGRRVDALLSTLPPDVHAASAALPQRLHPGTRPGDRWSTHFSPLSLLYPGLQLEGLVEMDDAALLSLAVPHTLFFVHAFVDDHELDGQLELVCAERLFTRWVFVSGLEQLRVALGDWDRAAEAIHRASLACLDAQTRDLGAPPDGTTLEEWQAQLIVRRAGVPAVMAPICALDRGVDHRHVIEIEAAVRDVVVGLQWLDDVRDWRDDLATGSQNLLLERVSRELGAGALGPLDVAATEEVFARLGLHQIALASAASHLRTARDRQRLLGAKRLARLLAERVELVERRIESAR